MKMKWLIGLFTLVCVTANGLGLVGCNSNPAGGGETLVATEGLKYRLSNGREYGVVGLGEVKETDIVIPSQYEGLPVTYIGNSAFADCDSLTSVVIPNSVTSIGNMAFRDCSSLTNITIPDSVTYIGFSAFVSCDSLTSVAIGKGITSISSDAFYFCNSLTDITVNKNNTAYKSIDGNLYSKDGKTLIRYAMGKTATSFAIPDGVTSIGILAFVDCDNLKSITIPDSVTSIDVSAFDRCDGLTSITVEENNITYKSMDGNVYSKDGKTLILYAMGKTATSFEIPDGVTSIGDEAFYNCDSLTSVVIPNSVISIDDSAFSYCDNLTSVEIPNSVTFIGERAFLGCDSLMSITVNENNIIYKSMDGNLYSKDGKILIQYAIGKAATSFVILDGVTSIGELAFAYCDSLTSVVIPNNVTSIGSWAFDDCNNLTIYCEAQSQPDGWSGIWNYSKRPVVWGYTVE